MGALILPASGRVYVDAQIVIYTVERHPSYCPLLVPLWKTRGERERNVSIITSELTILEALVQPLRNADEGLVADYEQVLLGADLELIPITQTILRRAASLRASVPSLRTPDALHAATALEMGCDQFLTNDKKLAHVQDLPFILLHDVLEA